jgi:hypothetical protein
MAEGKLVRKSRWRKEWHERYFILSSGRMQCKLRESDCDVKDEQNFENEKVLLEMLGRDVYEYEFPFRFDITVGKARRSYRCASEQDYLEWTSCIAVEAKPRAKLFTQVDVKPSSPSHLSGQVPANMLLGVAVLIPSSRLESINGVSSVSLHIAPCIAPCTTQPMLLHLGKEPRSICGAGVQGAK